MNRDDLQALSTLRLREARTLLDRNFAQGAYYLCGYAVECALKSCIAKQTQRYEFPDRKKVQSSHSHNLLELFKLSGLYVRFQRDWQQQPDLERNWGIVSNWSETSRYDPNVTNSDAKAMYWACASRKYGILAWIKHEW